VALLLRVQAIQVAFPPAVITPAELLPATARLPRLKGSSLTGVHSNRGSPTVRPKANTVSRRVNRATFRGRSSPTRNRPTASPRAACHLAWVGPEIPDRGRPAVTRLLAIPPAATLLQEGTELRLPGSGRPPAVTR
jgi:hypothetical protein